MRRRADQVDQTRQRITDAAVRLHTTVGPARSSIAAIAEEAGVTRLTVYRHFTDLDALFAACGAHWSTLNPRPDPRAWLEIPNLEERARRAFTELYDWYRVHADELYPIYRDAAAMPLSAQQATEAGNRLLADALVAGRAGGLADDAADEAEPDAEGRLLRAVARHLVDFWTWRSLVMEQDLDDREAVTIAVRLLRAVERDWDRRDTTLTAIDDVELRPATRDDAGAIADVYLASLRATYAFPPAHSDEQARQWIRDVVLPTQEAWVGAASDGAVVALMVLTSNMLDQLYVAPGWTGRGIGSRLLALARARRPGGLDLYTFQVNDGARRFYERHGFVEVARGDGSGNEEGQPDVRYAWRPSG